MKPSSILGRYLTRQIVFNFLAVLLVVLGIIFLFEMVERLRRISGHPDFGMWFAVQMAVARLPKTAEQVFPFVMMIAAMVTFWKLSKTNEFVVMRSAGVSIWGFLTPVSVITLVIGLVNVGLINPIAADLYGLFETLERIMDTKDPSALMFSDQGLWIREALPLLPPDGSDWDGSGCGQPLRGRCKCPSHPRGEFYSGRCADLPESACLFLQAVRNSG